MRATVSEILADLKCNPITEMVRIARDPKVDPAVRGNLYGKLANKIHADLRSVEHGGIDGKPIEHSFTLHVSRVEKT